MAISPGGEVVGFSNVSASAGGGIDFQAFRWTRRGGIRNIGVLQGDITSRALGVNKHGEIVGKSCNAKGACHAFLFRGGRMLNLNSLLKAGSGMTLVSADDINDAGLITGQAQAPGGALVAFVARPYRSHH